MADKTTPKYVQLKQEIMQWLNSGKFKANEQMPSEHEIAGMFRMSRQTVRQTLGELEKEGWLYRVQGRGTFVSDTQTKPVHDMLLIGMMTTYISDYIFPHIVRGAESLLRSKGYNLMLSSTDNDKAKETESLRLLLGQPVRGLIIEPTKSAQGNPNLPLYLSLQAKNIPFLMINERYPELDCPCLRVDDEVGGYRAASRLIQLGHRRIAGFFKTDDLQGTRRLKGFVRALREGGLPFHPDTVIPYATEEKATKPFEAALSMLAGEERPTALVCYNDELAVHLLEAVRRLGLSVPGDLSVIGFDDSPLATATEVKLTTLAHPKTKMGEDAARLLLQMIDKRDAAHAGDIVYTPELVERDSTGAV
ncbi:GntR family transcriptional regulator [Paenibacillus hamazuiensis]|uniref:GntR family transcriptional regulator n=1 Tax=Paenibacillus hamazuiensis TaxID=2936508 RepID=UPI00200BC1F8|nr:GntR family transcriptional regulator [Paenibacillus hamazuiensis]